MTKWVSLSIQWTKSVQRNKNVKPFPRFCFRFLIRSFVHSFVLSNTVSHSLQSLKINDLILCVCAFGYNWILNCEKWDPFSLDMYLWIHLSHRRIGFQIPSEKCAMFTFLCGVWACFVSFCFSSLHCTRSQLVN